MAIPSFTIKQKPTDAWSIREKLALASSVERTRDQNWVSVSRQIKYFAEPNRPPDWFSQKNCALQYGSLLENVEKTKRKRGEEIATPGSIIVKNLTQSRITELENSLKDDAQKIREAKQRIKLLKSVELDSRIDDLVNESNKRFEDSRKSQEEHRNWLRDRELEAERQKQLRHHLLSVKAKKQNRTVSDASDSFYSDDSNLPVAPESPLTPVPPSSSLLTNLLRSPTQSPSQSPRTTHGIVQNLPQAISAQRFSSDSQNSGNTTPIATSASQLPTLSKLLESPSFSTTTDPSNTSVCEAREPIGQVQPNEELPEAGITQSLTENDCERGKLQLQQQASQEEEEFLDLDATIAEAVTGTNSTEDVADDNIISVIEELQEDMQRKEQEEQRKQSVVTETEKEDENESCSTKESSTTLSSEKKDINSLIGNPCCRAEISSVESSVTNRQSVLNSSSDSMSIKQELHRSSITNLKDGPVESLESTPILATSPETIETNSTTQAQQIPSTTSPEAQDQESSEPSSAITKLHLKDDDLSTSIPKIASPKLQHATRQSTKDDEEENITKDEKETEDCNLSASKSLTEDGGGQDSQDTESRSGSNSSTSDDQVEERNDIELRAESESAMIEEEVSEEEATNDGEGVLTKPLEVKEENVTNLHDCKDNERNLKIWKKSALLVWRTAANHSNANVFMNSVTDEMAPGYEDIVYKPMDLLTIRKNIENGVIKTTMELLRDMMLMFQNAIMYNSADHDVYSMAIKMQEDVVKQIEELMANEVAEKAGGGLPNSNESLKRPARLRQSDIGLDPSAKKPRRSTGAALKQ